MDLQLTGRVVVVTGGSSGVGRAVVELLLGAGAQVATCARDEQRLRDAWSHLSKEPRERLFLASCDVRDADTTSTFVGTVAQRFGRIDALIANAGASTPGSFASASKEHWLAELGDKVLGAVQPLHAALPWLRRSDAARVVLVSSLIAREPWPRLGVVSAARAAQASLVRSLATELATDGVLVNSVSLGLIDTDAQRAVHAASASTVPYEQWAADQARSRGVPLGRMGRPQEVAPIVALLASPLASYLSGADVTVAGGAGHAISAG